MIGDIVHNFAPAQTIMTFILLYCISYFGPCSISSVTSFSWFFVGLVRTVLLVRGF